MTTRKQPAEGSCICPISPAVAIEHNLRQLMSETDRHAQHPLLDHRCPTHGEKAQPAVWGRHKELVLQVKLQEWRVLVVTKEEK